MSRPNNSTELGERRKEKELEVVLSEDFAKIDVGCISVTADSKSVMPKLKTVATMRLRGRFADMKPAGKLNQMTLAKKKERDNSRIFKNEDIR